MNDSYYLHEGDELVGPFNFYHLTLRRHIKELAPGDQVFSQVYQKWFSAEEVLEKMKPATGTAYYYYDGKAVCGPVNYSQLVDVVKQTPTVLYTIQGSTVWRDAVRLVLSDEKQIKEISLDTIGAFVICAGLVMGVFFFLFFDVRKPGTDIVNMDLISQRTLGFIAGGFITVFGFLIMIYSVLRKGVNKNQN
jgi:hypothetical protein